MQAPASPFQQLAQVYCRQSRQKWNVPLKWSLEGSAVETLGSAPTSLGGSAARRPNRPSLLRPPSGFGS
jgi:hypothetical protein